LRRIITLTTDFGDEDYYVGAMKGVILGINSDSNIVDITHKIPRHDIFKAAITIRNFSRYFPEDSIHVVVIDPGVGSERKPIAIETEHGVFVGPDNGVFSFIMESVEKSDIYEITNSDFMLDNASCTFHGRDIFAPVAAHTSKGIDICEVGVKIASPVLLNISKPIENEAGIHGEVIYTDSFGNLVTNITTEMLNGCKSICIDNFVIDAVASSYRDVKTGELLAIIGSSGYLEISVNQGSAADRIKNQKVTVKK